MTKSGGENFHFAASPPGRRAGEKIPDEMEERNEDLNYQPEPVYSKHEEMTKRQKFSQVEEIIFPPATSNPGS